MSTEISKKDVAILSAAIAAYLAESRPVGAIQTTPLFRNYGSMLAKLSELERRIDELSANLNALRNRVEK